MTTPVMTPCVGICKMQEQTALQQHTPYCLGCWRTLDEIAHWATMAHQQRLDVMAQLPARAQFLAQDIPTYRAEAL